MACGEPEPADRTAAKNTLAVLVVCGHGVVTKPDDAQITARVKADPGTFLWSSANGLTSFVRRERLDALTEELTAEGIVLVRIFCADAAADFGLTAAELAGSSTPACAGGRSSGRRPNRRLRHRRLCAVRRFRCWGCCSACLRRTPCFRRE